MSDSKASIHLEHEMTMSLAKNSDGACPDDAEIPVIEAMATGDRYAFEEFVQRHSDWVRAVIYGVLGGSERIDDVSQQVWMSVWEQANRLRQPAKWRSWLYRLTRNAAVDAGRGATRRKNRSAEAPILTQEHAAPDDNPAALERSEQRSAVVAAIRSLPPLYREPLVLRHLQGWSYQQIADAMNVPTDTIETRVVRARRLLRDALEGKV
jgi:RNA polymerase sigma-70 factor (ECF subfamily)